MSGNHAMKTAELFAGIGGFRLAAERTGWKTVWANDLCPKACAVYRDRFGPSELVEGDFAGLVSSVPEHDLLTAGFPCQPFSSAGKKEGIRDARGTLFHLIVEVLRERRPSSFVLENVKRLLTMERGHHFATILSALAGLDYVVEWRLLNAMHFGLPQNRERIFLIGTLADGGAPAKEPLREPPPIRLATADDLASLAAPGRVCLSDPGSWWPIPSHGERFPTWGLAWAGRCFAADLGRFSAASAPVTLASVLQPDVPAEFDFTETTLEWVETNRPVNRFVNGVEIVSNQRGGARMGYTIFGTRGVAPTLTSTTSRHYERYQVGDRYRRLTNVEYARIQGFPDDHCRAVSVYDQYALLGNAVPPPMAGWVMQRLGGPGIRPKEVLGKGPRTLFDHVHDRRTPADGAG